MRPNGNSLDDVLRRIPIEMRDLLVAETDNELIDALTPLLHQAITHLERNSKNFQSLDEVGLSADFCGSLSNFGLSVNQETHSNGHVDLTINVQLCVPAKTVLAEAKIYNGPKYHISGLEQLLQRYLTGREACGFVITYVKRGKINNRIKKLRQVMDRDKPLNQKGPTADHALKWSFKSTHAHSSGSNIQIDHHGCNLCVNEKSE